MCIRDSHDPSSPDSRSPPRPRASSRPDRAHPSTRAAVTAATARAHRSTNATRAPPSRLIDKSNSMQIESNRSMPRARARVLPRASPRRFEDHDRRPPRRVSPRTASSTVDRHPKTVARAWNRTHRVPPHPRVMTHQTSHDSCTSEGSTRAAYPSPRPTSSTPRARREASHLGRSRSVTRARVRSRRSSRSSRRERTRERRATATKRV